MLIAPHAPAPTAMHKTAVKASTGFSRPGATSKPIAPVKTTSDITRGFSSAIQSRTSVSHGVSQGVSREISRGACGNP